MDDPFNAFCDHTAVAFDGAADGPLAGLSFAAKDVFDIADYRTGGGNPDWLMSQSPAPNHAAVVESLLSAGASLAGKTQMDELSRGIFGENPHYGTPINPRAKDRVPGGSSSGSAVAVAAGMVDFAIGTDTGGSVRAPASFCGVFGMRPTHGRLPLDGVLGLAPSFDTVGWFARDADMLARVGEVLLGAEAVDTLPPRMVIAEDAFAAADEAVAAALAPAVERLAAAVGDSERTEISPEGLENWRGHQAVLHASEARETFRDWIDDSNPRFGFEVSQIITLAEQITDTQIDAAQKAWPQFVSHLYTILTPGTVLCLPTMPFAAPLRGQPRSEMAALRTRVITLTCVAGLMGAPQISLPLGEIDGAPLGLSLMGRPGSDEQLLGAARRLATTG